MLPSLYVDRVMSNMFSEPLFQATVKNRFIGWQYLLFLLHFTKVSKRSDIEITLLNQIEMSFGEKKKNY